MSIGGHHSHAALKEEWLTPPYIINALGPFDLDPCAPVVRPWATAYTHYDINDNGLNLEWAGRVWCNPPYGKQSSQWLAKLAHHGNGIALIFARTETAMFVEHVWRSADALLFIEGRLYFHHANGKRSRLNAGAPSVLIAYGIEMVGRLRNCEIPGKFIRLEK